MRPTRAGATIADIFRQEAGFARLLDAYGAELAVPPGHRSERRARDVRG